MIAYVDASVLLRVILGEPERLLSWQTLTPVSSALVRVECLRMIERARMRFDVDEAELADRRADVLSALATFTLAPITPAILDRAAEPFPTSINTLDAIHLATALTLRDDFESLVVATHDRELATAARAVGFTVEGV